MATPSWSYVLKFIITGDASVGKSSLLIRLTDQRFLANPDPTLGVEFGSKVITIPETGTVVKLQCWDTAGTESFRSITRSYYRGAAGCLLVYDVTSRRSFLNARSWLKDVRQHADPHLACILVGNKVDLVQEDKPLPEISTKQLPEPPGEAEASTDAPTEASAKPAGTVRGAKKPHREVTYDEAKQFADEEGMLFVEASAKSGHNVTLAFIDAARVVLERVGSDGVGAESQGIKLTNPTQGVQLSATGAEGGSKCC
ncbi:ras-domain-containing protein [Mycena floridula]|nr:ras-domain-containing protein [Mycena floridula]